MTRIVVSSEGIEYNIWGRKGFAFWHDIQHFGIVEIGKERKWGIALSSEIIETHSYLWRMCSINSTGEYYEYPLPVHLFTIYKTKRFLGKDIDLEHFQKTKLGSAIHYYAPHLFEYDAEKGKGERHV
jgi:hypothetical protein